MNCVNIPNSPFMYPLELSAPRAACTESPQEGPTALHAFGRPAEGPAPESTLCVSSKPAVSPGALSGPGRVCYGQRRPPVETIVILYNTIES